MGSTPLSRGSYLPGRPHGWCSGSIVEPLKISRCLSRVLLCNLPRKLLCFCMRVGYELWWCKDIQKFKTSYDIGLFIIFLNLGVILDQFKSK